VLTVVVGGFGLVGAVTMARAARRAEVQGRSVALAPVRPRAGAGPRSGVHRRLDRALHDAGVAMPPRAAVQLWAGAVVAGGTVGLALAPTLAVAGALGALVGGPASLVGLRHRAGRRVAAAVPEMLERVAADLRAGGTVAGALGGAAAGPLAADLARVRGRVELGAGLADALVAWVGERPVAGVREAAGALATATTLGGAAAAALEGLAASLRARLAVLAEARALATQARVSAVVVGGAPLAYLAFTGIVDPTSAAVLVATGTGRVCLGAGLALEGLASLWMWRILAVVR
jgi:tight adherence protein B